MPWISRKRLNVLYVLADEVQSSRDAARRWENVHRSGHDMTADGIPKCIPNPALATPTSPFDEEEVVAYVKNHLEVKRKKERIARLETLLWAPETHYDSIPKVKEALRVLGNPVSDLDSPTFYLLPTMADFKKHDSANREEARRRIAEMKGKE